MSDNLDHSDSAAGTEKQTAEIKQSKVGLTVAELKALLNTMPDDAGVISYVSVLSTVKLLANGTVSIY